MTAPAVGSRMRVCHSDGYWHYGTLQASEKKGKFCIVFDDDDRIVTALPHRDIQVLAPGAHGSTVGDAPEQAVFHGSFKKRRAKQQVERYAPQETPKDSLDSPRAEAPHKGADATRGKDEAAGKRGAFGGPKKIADGVSPRSDTGDGGDDEGASRRGVGAGRKREGAGDDLARPTKKRAGLAAAAAAGAAGAAAADALHSPKGSQKKQRSLPDSESDGGGTDAADIVAGTRVQV